MDTTPGSSSRTLLRVAAGLTALPFTGFALLMLFAQIRSGLDSFQLILGSTAATLTILCWYFVVRGHHAESRSRLRYALWGGFLLGGASFTGPAAFVVGVILGALYAMFRV